MRCPVSALLVHLVRGERSTCAGLDRLAFVRCPSMIYKFLLQHLLLIGLLGSGACLLSARQDWAPPRSYVGTYFRQAVAILFLLATCWQEMIHKCGHFECCNCGYGRRDMVDEKVGEPEGSELLIAVGI